MKEIVVISGKGGTGKTSITSSFAVLGRNDIVIADCDVDAADMHLLMAPQVQQKHDFYSSFEAVIDPEKCTNCGACQNVCRFDAIGESDSTRNIIPLNCEGCGYCAKVCPSDAITMQQRLDGEWYVSATRLGAPMVHAKLGIGTENSGKLVATVKNIAKQIAEKLNKEYILIDGSPGVGCPVISSLSGAALVVLVTEPTVSGLNDLKRVHELIKRFRLPAALIINKFNLNTKVYEELKQFAKEENILHLADLPYDESFSEAITNGTTIVEYSNNGISETIGAAWEEVMQYLEN